MQAERGELETAKQAAEARAAELTKTVEQATAQAREMDQQLLAVAARWQNAQLNAPLRHALGDQMDADARATQTALQSQAEPDGARAGERRDSAPAARWASEQRIAAADSARVEAEARLSEMRASLQRAEQEKASIGADLAKVK